jgi:hypothetical protein
MTKVTIDQADFSKYFFDIKKHGPKPGQVLARWQAIAYFVDGWLKRNVIDLLQKDGGGDSSVKVMRNLVGCVERDSYRVPLEMAKDLLTMTNDEVANKEYKMHIEYFYWTERKYIPDDPHWTCINIIKEDEDAIALHSERSRWEAFKEEESLLVMQEQS